MGRVKFSPSKARAQVNAQVDAGMQIMANRIVGLAKSLAPVRKTRPYQRKRNRGRPFAVGLYFQGTRYRMKNDEFFAQFTRPSTLEEAASGAEEQVRRNPDEIEPSEILAALSARGLEARAVPRRGQKVSYDSSYNIKRMAGVRITPQGRMFYGGRLRRSIGAKAIGRGKMRGYSIQAMAPYAMYVEFPTHRRKTGSTKAQPFLLPAVKAWFRLEHVGKAMKR